jgi:hypothetical protein
MVTVGHRLVAIGRVLLVVGAALVARGGRLVSVGGRLVGVGGRLVGIRRGLGCMQGSLGGKDRLARLRPQIGWRVMPVAVAFADVHLSAPRPGPRSPGVCTICTCTVATLRRSAALDIDENS